MSSARSTFESTCRTWDHMRNRRPAITTRGEEGTIRVVHPSAPGDRLYCGHLGGPRSERKVLRAAYRIEHGAGLSFKGWLRSTGRAPVKPETKAKKSAK
jgi:hypothetical protein